MKTPMLAALILLGSTQAHALQTVDYGWEDGVGTLLGSYGNLADPVNVTGAQLGSNGVDPYGVAGAHGGDRFLHVAEDPIGGTPQAYVAFITGLQAGDEISASFWGYDDTAGSNPSLRIWGHYAVSGDVNSYEGSAGGNTTYTDGSGWSQVGNTWTFAPSSAGADALVVEARLYSGSGGRTDFWIDDLQVIAPDHATVQFAAAPVPEPESYALMLAGLGLLGGVVRRRTGR
ncbi:PEP-CTERM sorting domain-containing protein [Nitrogeniibacter mangrovi]|uniref:PEP-CTERM sorting domain-containing protein n=1 Tax=Nitrogeniibacter mangrovi TaxID=2016596 RepID=A0A6C1B2C7_9RHOO|nr:PEP-CTERM sorting domain-containing protein [Nitrogeniibacter mangrovi]QID17533.1 PEP-CTERM sorting domain-containing protein [Nitrogeniibacter mangrovi]